MYGSALFWIFLTERTKNPAMIKEIWTNAQSGGLGNLYSLQRLTRRSRTTATGRCHCCRCGALWNTQLGAGYAEAASYPAQKMWQSLSMGANVRDSGTSSSGSTTWPTRT